MSSKVEELSIFPKLTFTHDSLSDVIRFINDENVVVLHTKVSCCVFHKIPFLKPENLASLNMVRVIYLDCNGYPDVLKGTGWPLSIKKAIKSVNELGLCAVTKAIVEQKGILNKVSVVFGSNVSGK